MTTLTIRQTRAALGRLDELLEQEGEVIVTRMGKPVARLVPVQPRKAMPSLRDLRSRMPFLTVPSEVYIREDRDAR
jgi:prevent-host-death family protein